MARNKVVQVRIEDRILWIGGAAYPVQNIAVAMTVEYVPRRMAAIVRFLSSMAILLAVLVLLARTNIPHRYGYGYGYGTLVRPVALALVAFFAFRMLRVLFMRTRYAVYIGTSGSPFAVLGSTDEREMREIVDQVAKAINNPEARYHTTVTNILGDVISGDKVFGDKFKVFGENNMGKQVGA
ncbi:DUF6232 family protein [Streptomyces sp. UNOC14_S4]|uniref:DUF6232 family protein n=1 Tax=Streptomyces sp. UNOC14_S4 TaxID=2872340 RepID=UPI001E425C86|nr:DUF6232 family protein [Streptomyces sp. UNOC14_S4]MCC3767819.1 hypothetical protein [Streptomyces sp. UNOC14_S4]